MGEYFKAWRRKVGIVTLLIACALMAGWVRSEVNYCVIRFNGNHESFRIGSYDGMLGFIWVSFETVNEDPFLDWDYGPLSAILENGVYEPFRRQEGMDWRWEWAGFHFGGGTASQTATYSESFYFPYWSIVVPLTLVSAYVLLSKQRKPPRKQSDEPAATEAP